MMQCPKDKKVELVATKVADNLAVNCCSSCQGMWIPSSSYEEWQPQHSSNLQPNLQNQPAEFEASPFDAKAGLCPECGSYLTRTRLNLKKPFYLERCSTCGGIWCDRGEWEVLEACNLHVQIPQLFSSKWQVQMRELQYLEQERSTLIEKLGVELAEQLFAIADALEKHEHGDFAVAYLMRRFNKGDSE